MTELVPVHAGKVRELYDAGPDHCLMVASDRISAFDVVFHETVPDKGRVLTAMTVWWSDYLQPLAPTHVVSADPDVYGELCPAALDRPDWAGRTLLVRKAEMLPIECIVRGYLTGSAWREYQHSATMHGQPLPVGLQESAQLPDPVFTPSTKAVSGHDENISVAEAADLVGADIASAAADICVAAYSAAARHAAASGVIIADTKFELGFVDGRLVIADEILTPDSSRFWPADQWRLGASPPSLDKEPVRRHSAATGWDKRPPPPPLPPSVVDATRRRYIDAYETVTGERFADWDWQARNRSGS